MKLYCECILIRYSCVSSIQFQWQPGWLKATVARRTLFDVRIIPLQMFGKIA